MSDLLAERGVSIAFQDADMLIVDKPFGLAAQAGRDGEEGLIELIQRAGFPTACLHHRLDQTASGLMAIGLSTRANPGLAEAFREHSAQRTYRAVLGGILEQDCTWHAPIDHQPARSHVAAVATAGGFSAVEIQLETGRTHQIRKHAAMAGLPIVGDRRYGGELGRAWPRLCLHAAALAIPHPITRTFVRVRSPIPDDLSALWQMAGGS